jgi:hypothetical protein
LTRHKNNNLAKLVLLESNDTFSQATLGSMQVCAMRNKKISFQVVARRKIVQKPIAGKTSLTCLRTLILAQHVEIQANRLIKDGLRSKLTA